MAGLTLGQVLEVDITSLNSEAQGIARHEGYTLFVPGALPEETVLARITKLNPTYGFAALERVIQVSPERAEPPCPIYEFCGGCQIQHMVPSLQNSFKEQVVREALVRIGRFPDALVESLLQPILSMAHPWRYRNKAQVPVQSIEPYTTGARAQYDVNSELAIGFYARRSHRIAPLEGCPLQKSAVERGMIAARDVLRALGAKPYDETKHTGDIRHIVVRTTRDEDELLVALVTRTPRLPYEQAFVRQLRDRLPEVKSISINVQSKQSNVIFGPETRLLWGEERLIDRIGSMRFYVSLRSFFQVTPAQTDILYDVVRAYAALSGEETVVDVYSGVGTIALSLAPYARRVIGIESVPDAVRDARENAKLNGVDHASFIEGEAEVVLDQIVRESEPIDVLIVDPPRKGLAPEVVEVILQARPKRFIYVSCNPATLARDLRLFVDGGYRMEKIQPVDMFPQTVHVECVVLMSRV
ncbi:MAG: RNA methyltransferase, TrmA family [Candidatus Carbobacillus altaicus]|uniref:RNA methyltransferase, TrmA family n=1 Tax=Candidatus Carbonibacillus altaicus TaxID=2163959 RepID=A0A2R6Y4B4_9BACL|nr:MAG: RNA methyltransferase, TrmA family [Candidatus Carbobacillus altaicus]